MHRNQYVEDPTLIQQREGFSLLDIKRYVDSIGYQGVGMAELEIDDLIKMAPIMTPINLYGYNHFVIFRGVAGNRVLLADPAWGNRTMLLSRFESAWISYAGIGKVGFIIKQANAKQEINRLAPSLNDFSMLR